MRLYLKFFLFELIKSIVKRPDPNNNIAELSLVILLSLFHISSNGMTVSQEQEVVPKGGSVRTMSTECSGMVFIISRQSP